MASPKKDIPWPPQTTQDILNLTPRKQRPVHPPSLSPSPLKHANNLDGAGLSSSEDSDTEEEKSLKLELARINAELKLRELQKQKRKKKKELQRDIAPPRSHPEATSRIEPETQVPCSPERKPPPASQNSPNSPSRILLGIDKGLKGRDVSLRRAPQYRQSNWQAQGKAGRPSTPPKPEKSFSERIAEERENDKCRKERRKLIERSRSKGFGTGAASEASSSLSSSNRETASLTLESQAREPTISTQPLPSSSGENSAESSGPTSFDSFSSLHLSRRTTPHHTLTRALNSKSLFTLPSLLRTVVGPSFSPPDIEGDYVVLGIIASKSDPRSIGQNTSSKKSDAKYMVLTLTDLKQSIELMLFGAGFSRWWKLPVSTVIAVLNPGILKPKAGQEASGRFSLTINDDSADCVLEIGVARDLGFCKAVKRDGKVCESWVDVRHTHFCAFHVEQTVKKARVTRAEVNSTTRLFEPPPMGQAVRNWGQRGGARAGKREGRDDGLLKEGPVADLPTRFGGGGGNVFVAPGRSTAQLLDDPDYLPEGSGMHRATREERLRKRLKEGKEERELTQRIIKSQGRGGGIGATYLQTGLNRKHGLDSSSRIASVVGEESVHGSDAKDDLEDLRRRRKAAEVQLSPVKFKRKRSNSGRSNDGVPVVKKTRFLLSQVSDGDEEDDLEIV